METVSPPRCLWRSSSMNFIAAAISEVPNPAPAGRKCRLRLRSSKPCTYNTPRTDGVSIGAFSVWPCSENRSICDRKVRRSEGAVGQTVGAWLATIRKKGRRIGMAIKAGIKMPIRSDQLQLFAFSSTISAPAPPSIGLAWQNARISSFCTSQLRTLPFNTGSLLTEPRPLP